MTDLVAQAEFPDIRRRYAIHSAAGSVMVILRERISPGEYPNRSHVHLPETVLPDNETVVDGNAGVRAKAARQLRGTIIQECILQQAADAMKPYYIRAKNGVGWSTGGLLIKCLATAQREGLSGTHSIV